MASGRGTDTAMAEVGRRANEMEEMARDAEDLAAEDPMAAVLGTLERLLEMMEVVQESQQHLEERQGEMETSVRCIESELAELAKAQAGTAMSVKQVLEKARKVNANVKDVRQQIDKQTHEIRKLEGNHGELLKRNNFRIMVYQEALDTPLATVTTRKRSKAELSTTGDAEVHASPEDTHPVDEADGLNLSSDEDAEMIEEVESKAEKFKRTGKKRVESFRRAFTKENLGKRVNQIVSPERRDKIRHSFAPAPRKTESDTQEGVEEARAEVGEGKTSHSDSAEVIESKTPVAAASSEKKAEGGATAGDQKPRRMESFKKTFSRQALEKQVEKLDKLGKRIVPTEKRERIKKSLTPEHKQAAGVGEATSAASSPHEDSTFKVPPFKFTVKKVREGDVVGTEEYQIDPTTVEAASQDAGHSNHAGENEAESGTTLEKAGSKQSGKEHNVESSEDAAGGVHLDQKA
uniref:caveolae-associated protein 1-like n=1 Tax=Myxine glutinosa TaxID=7769 RepID=UPI00358F5DEB